VLAAAKASAKWPVFVAPRALPPRESSWGDNTRYACDLAAAGDIDGALSLLHLQIGASSFTAFKPALLTLWAASHTSVPGPVLLTPALSLGLQRVEGEGVHRPPVSLTIAAQFEVVRGAYRMFSQGQAHLPEAQAAFTAVLRTVPLLRPSKSEMAEVEKLLGECRQYLLALRIELKRREMAPSNPVRAAELACYFTHCNLQPAHDAIALQTAMSATFKIKNLVDAGSFAKRLLERGVPEPMAQKTRQLLMLAEQTPTNTHTLEYDPRNPFVVCGHSLRPIFKGSRFEQCPFCRAYAEPEFKGQLCAVCGVSKLGAQATGLFAENRF